MAASPIFEREFESNSVHKNGIRNTDVVEVLMPDLNPEAFRLFINLTILDTWSLDHLKDLNLTPDQLLNMITVCRRYEMTWAVKNLEEITKNYIQSFHKFKENEEFLLLSQGNLETILSSDELGMGEEDIFECVSRWMEFQSSRKEAVKKEAGLDIEASNEPMPTQSDVEATPANDPKISKLSLQNGFQIVESPSFECDGVNNYHWISSKQKVALTGLGFLGPVKVNTEAPIVYEVNIEIKKFSGNQVAFSSGKLSKNISVQEKGEKSFLILTNQLYRKQVVEAETHGAMITIFITL